MKLILAIVQKDDEAETIEELNKKHFFVTRLSTTGGFLKGKNATLLIGTDESQVDKALAIIKKKAGSRKTIHYTTPQMESGAVPNINMSAPLDVDTGGATVFVIDMDQFHKF